MATKAPKKLNSLGKILKSQDFELFKKTIEEMDIEVINSRTEENNYISTLDELMFFASDVMIKKISDEEKEKIDPNNPPKPEIAPGFFEMINFLIDKGAKPNITYSHNFSSFLKSALIPLPDLTKFYLDNAEKFGIDIYEKDKQGKDLLIHAVEGHSFDTIEYLLKNNLFAVNKKYFLLENQTALHIACSEGEETIIYQLIKHGAELDIKDSNGEMPYKYVPSIDLTPQPSEEEMAEIMKKNPMAALSAMQGPDPEELLEKEKFDKLFEQLKIQTEEYISKKAPISKKYKTSF